MTLNVAHLLENDKNLWWCTTHDTNPKPLINEIVVGSFGHYRHLIPAILKILLYNIYTYHVLRIRVCAPSNNLYPTSYLGCFDIENLCACIIFKSVIAIEHRIPYAIYQYNVLVTIHATLILNFISLQNFVWNFPGPSYSSYYSKDEILGSGLCRILKYYYSQNILWRPSSEDA